MEEKKVVFLGFIFELFCRFFSNKDVSGFFGLFNVVIEVSLFDYGYMLLSICILYM